MRYISYKHVSQLSSSCIIDDGEDFVVAIIYPIQEITPRIPPTIIKWIIVKQLGSILITLEGMSIQKTQIWLERIS